MMRVFVLVVCLLFALGSLPGGSAIPGHAAEHQYRSQFLASHPGVPMDAVGLVYTEHDVLELTLRDAADLYAARMVAFIEDHKGDPPAKARKPASGNGKGSQAAAAESAPPWVGHFSLTEFLFFPGANPTVACSQLRDQAHYTVAVPIPNDPDDWFVGAAYSDVAEHGSGYIYDINTQETFHYGHPVYYGGASDFFCFEIRAGNQFFLTNNPTVIGFVIGADV